MTSTPSPPRLAVRRRASRAAGPAKGNAAGTTTVRLETTPVAAPKPAAPKSGGPPRRPANRHLVTLVALAFGFIATAAVAAVVAVMVVQQKHVEAAQAHNQRFVDTATQTVVNMFSFRQDNIDDSVNRFFDSTSGPLRGMMSQNHNIENLKTIFRDTGGSSEAVVTGAALESVDSVSNNASVLVAIRVTVSDTNGNNKPSQAYRMRVIVHEDENGRMTTYDLKYPNGGN
jgi:Mce-associated membrane protein